MSSSNSQCFSTHAMPKTLWPGHGASAAACATGDSGISDSYRFSLRLSLERRRMSSYGASSSSSNSSSSTALHLSRRLPFASITGDHAASNGQLRWLSLSSSSAQQQQQQQQEPQQQQQQQQQEPQQQQQQLDEEALLAAAKAATAPDTFKSGDVLAGGRYLLQHKLGSGPIGLAEGCGEGRFTTLWMGKDMASGQQVVLKLMEPADAVSYTAGTREAALHAMAGRHPNVVPLLDAFEHRSPSGRHACMVMERQGSPLDFAFTRWRLLHLQDSQRNAQQLYGESLPGCPEGMAALRSISRQLLQALDHLHTRGIAHMDLSLDNVLLDKPFLSEVESVAARSWTSLLNTAWHALLDTFGSKSSQQVLQQQLSEASTDTRTYYTRATLHKANVKVTDFGRAAPYRQLAAQPDAMDVAQPDTQPPWGRTLGFAAGDGLVGARRAVPYNADGVLVMSDPTLRPPEEILGLPYTSPAYDIWRLGCILSELAIGSPLFSIESWAFARAALPALQQHSDDSLHLMDMQACLGSLPRELIRRSPLFSTLFYQNDTMRVSNVYELPPRRHSISRAIAAATHHAADKDQVYEFQNFVTSMLVYDPAKRPSAAELLQHKFLQQEQEGEQQQQPQQQQQQQQSNR